MEPDCYTATVSVSPNKPAALAAIKRGEDPKAVASRYGITWATFRVWMSRWRKAGELPAIGGQVVRLPAVKTKQQKLEESHQRHQQSKLSSRARATPPVDRLVLRRIARQLVRKLDTGLMCEKCDGEDAAPLKPGEFLSLTKAYVTHLDALARSLEVEGTLGDAEAGADELDLDSPETVAALGRSLTQLGPRRLVAVLEADGHAARVVRAALAELDREAV
jgi:transposase